MYSEKVAERLRGFGISIGDRIKMGEKEGILMPKPETGDPNCVVLKLDNGYNIGLNYEDGIVFEKLEGKAELEKFPQNEVKFD
ncbi:MAG: Glu-tRNA(Gln) amidotransferase GatDE subunit D, partial [Candidatus Micrarchaeota archaeon]